MIITRLVPWITDRSPGHVPNQCPNNQVLLMPLLISKLLKFTFSLPHKPNQNRTESYRRTPQFWKRIYEIIVQHKPCLVSSKSVLPHAYQGLLHMSSPHQSRLTFTRVSNLHNPAQEQTSSQQPVNIIPYLQQSIWYLIRVKLLSNLVLYNIMAVSELIFTSHIAQTPGKFSRHWC